MYGNLAPEGSVGKITGKEGLTFQGIAKCFDSEERMLEELAKDPSAFKACPNQFLYTVHCLPRRLSTCCLH